MTRTPLLPLRPLFASVGLLLLGSSVQANFVFSQVPAFRGGACSRFAGWEAFTSAYLGGNAPDDPLTTTFTPSITQLVPGAFLTGTGNIYDPLNVLDFVLADATAHDLQELVLQTSTVGNTIDVGSVLLRYVDGLGVQQSLPPTSTQLLGVTGMHDERMFTWDLSGVGDTIQAYEIVWQGAAPSMSFDAALLDTRDDCPPGTAFCFGDGTQATPCPCGNSGLAGRGCENSGSTGGALLTANGMTFTDTIVFSAQGTLPNSLAIVLQGNAALNPGLAFGDGVRCAGGGLKRLYVKHAVGGVVTAPEAGDLSVSAQSAALGDPLGTGAVRSYQVYYRDPSPGFCAAPQGNSWNVTNGQTLTW